jgi:fermentation-respiration switch protein FrsA (DUF1100 family)
MMDTLVRKPKGNGPFPAVLLVPGLGMTKHEWKGTFDEIAKTLVEAGFLTVQFAFDIFKENGQVVELPVFTRAKSVEKVLRWMLSVPEVDKGRVGLIAQSYGVPTATAANLSEVRSVLFVSGVYFPYENFVRIWPTRGTTLNFDGDTVRHHDDGKDTTVGKEFWTELMSFDQLALTKKLTMPVFIIQGDQDKYSISDQVEAVYQTLPGKKKKKKTYKGGDHGINEVPRQIREEFLRDVVAWFTESLAKPQED